jgi:hypothetical protein
MTTTSPARPLALIEREIEAASIAAQAEQSFAALPGQSTNPWSGSVGKLKALEAGRDQMRLRAKGEALQTALNEFRSIQDELERVTQERAAAEAELAEAERSPLVQKWRNAPGIARNMGYGQSWVQWSDFFLSAKPITHGAPECAIFFKSTECPERLRFDLGAEREAIIAYNTMRGQCTRLLVHWGSVEDRRQHLLRSCPELKGIA